MITENDKWNIEKGTYFIHSLSSNTLYASVMAVILQRPVIVIRIINLFAVCKCTNIQWTNFFHRNSLFIVFRSYKYKCKNHIVNVVLISYSV